LTLLKYSGYCMYHLLEHNKTPHSAYTQNYFCVLCAYITSSPTRGRVYHLQLLLVLASAVTLRSESRRTHDHIFLSQIRDSLHLEGQVSVFIPPRKRVVQLYPQALGSRFVASYDSQGTMEVFGAASRRVIHDKDNLGIIYIYISLS
jgi:hypothetical protein